MAMRRCKKRKKSKEEIRQKNVRDKKADRKE
jgi:hypothetical protein